MQPNNDGPWSLTRIWFSPEGSVSPAKLWWGRQDVIAKDLCERLSEENSGTRSFNRLRYTHNSDIVMVNTGLQVSGL
ncbi:Hypothetical protein SMAX5B_003454 [Scophthalmus maximus]|uniref:Uncharacterized protein n=1 Tax=Scophthalmus maximus TaxID=52904 RepID=A0A2U9CJW3_SCOMX|nr:Hypothetical protein SMAX5B_003454 [Scophthalmus maximus]KAF0044613.1 hypothetical protein F2P81_003771 [Scophthalmus maximus]